MVDQKGFTLIELVIAIAIIGILSAIAYPNYQKYVIKTKRADMMAELTSMGGKIESAKLAQGSYSRVNAGDYQGNFPKTGVALYTTQMTPIDDGNGRVTGWTLTATPISGTMMADDGVLTYNHQGVKCRSTQCGTGNEWKD